MGKMLTSMSIMAGIVFLFWLGGVIEPGVVTILEYMRFPQFFQSLSLGLKIGVVALTVAAVGAAVIAFGNKADFVLVVPIVVVFLSFAWDSLQIFQAMSAVGPVASIVAMMLISPFLMMYVVSIVDWWRGVET